MMFKIAVLTSTRGTDLQAIIDEMKAGKMPDIELVAVFSNKKNCYALERAKNEGYKAIFVNQKNRTREEFDRRLTSLLDREKVDLIVLVGYMRILTSAFVRHFTKKIINVHPALLPKFGGKDFFDTNVHEAVLQSGDKETGMTIHYVEEDIDTGPIIMQKKIKIDKNDTPETLKAKVQELEKKWYPEAIRRILTERKK